MNFLKAQHSLGKILYFDQHGLEKFIIVQPQSMVNILRSFITDELFWPDDESLRDILHAMINTGEIAKKGLLKLWSQKEFDQHMPNNDLKEFIIQVLVHLDILVEPKRYSQEQKSIVQSYLVPCIVKRKLPVTDADYKSKEDKMICLSYKLLKSSIPAALSFKLIGAAINIWPLKETREGVCLYHQAAILCIDKANELHISVKDNKIIIYLINKDTTRFISPNIASTVQECLTLTLKNVLEFYHKSFGKSLSTSEVSNLFEIEIGEWCDTGACYISVPEVKTMMEWTCKNKKTHKTKFPLFWIFDKTQDTCDERCSGLDKKDLELCPTDKHLVRLAGLVQFDIFYELVIHLGLSNMSWNNILEQYRGYDLKVMKFVALCEWRQQKYKEMEMTSFKDLSDALTTINHHRHVLCQVFRENVKVLGIDGIELQRVPDDDVLKELSEQVGNCAIQLGVELGLSMMEIEQTLF